MGKSHSRETLFHSQNITSFWLLYTFFFFRKTQTNKNNNWSTLAVVANIWLNHAKDNSLWLSEWGNFDFYYRNYIRFVTDSFEILLLTECVLRAFHIWCNWQLSKFSRDLVVSWAFLIFRKLTAVTTFTLHGFNKTFCFILGSLFCLIIFVLATCLCVC